MTTKEIKKWWDAACEITAPFKIECEVTEADYIVKPRLDLVGILQQVK